MARSKSGSPRLIPGVTLSPTHDRIQHVSICGVNCKGMTMKSQEVCSSVPNTAGPTAVTLHCCVHLPARVHTFAHVVAHDRTFEVKGPASTAAITSKLVLPDCKFHGAAVYDTVLMERLLGEPSTRNMQPSKMQQHPQPLPCVAPYTNLAGPRRVDPGPRTADPGALGGESWTPGWWILGSREVDPGTQGGGTWGPGWWILGPRAVDPGV